MKASQVRPGDWVLRDGKVVDIIYKVDPHWEPLTTVLIQRNGSYIHTIPTGEVTTQLVTGGQRIMRPTGGTVGQLMARSSRLLAAAMAVTQRPGFKDTEGNPAYQELETLAIVTLRVNAALELALQAEPAVASC